MHISILLFWIIIIGVAGVFFFAGYVLSSKLKNNDSDIMVMAFTIGITDRDKKIKELESRLN